MIALIAGLVIVLPLIAGWSVAVELDRLCE